MAVVAVCRECAWQGERVPETARCVACHSARLVTHDALGALHIAHLDCDAFYAAVEKRDDPTLADKPVLVGGRKRGVVMACCYVARRYGIHSAMPMFKALKACPDAVVVGPDMEKYARIGREVRALMEETTPLVEPISIDEAFLDLSGTEAVHGGAPAHVLVKLTRRIEDQIGITASIGLSYNKFLAKVASDIDKPCGFTVIGQAEASRFLADKSVSVLWGVGAALRRRLERDGITLIGDLLSHTEEHLVERYGVIGHRLARFARGQDNRSVKPTRDAKTVSSETTFAENISDPDALKARLWRQCERVARRMRKNGLAGRTATLKLKTHDFNILTRSRTLSAPTQLAEVLFQVTAPLLAREADGRRYRLIGVGFSDLSSAEDADRGDLFEEDIRRAAVLERTVDTLHDRFGAAAPKKGRGLRK